MYPVYGRLVPLGNIVTEIQYLSGTDLPVNRCRVNRKIGCEKAVIAIVVTCKGKSKITLVGGISPANLDVIGASGRHGFKGG